MPLLWLSLAWSTGIVAGQQAKQPAVAWLLFTGGALRSRARRSIWWTGRPWSRGTWGDPLATLRSTESPDGPGPDPETIAGLLRSGITQPVTAFLLADGGYAAVNPPKWLEKGDPQLALLLLEAGDVRGRPSAETLQALAGVPLLRTGQRGWIELISDRQQVWVEVERWPTAEAGSTPSTPDADQQATTGNSARPPGDSALATPKRVVSRLISRHWRSSHRPYSAQPG
jgi:hypothetical protein